MLFGSLFQYLAILTEYEFFLTAVLNFWIKMLLLFILVLNHANIEGLTSTARGGITC